METEVCGDPALVEGARRDLAPMLGRPRGPSPTMGTPAPLHLHTTHQHHHQQLYLLTLLNITTFRHNSANNKYFINKVTNEKSSLFFTVLGASKIKLNVLLNVTKYSFTNYVPFSKLQYSIVSKILHTFIRLCIRSCVWVSKSSALYKITLSLKHIQTWFPNTSALN